MKMKYKSALGLLKAIKQIAITDIPYDISRILTEDSRYMLYIASNLVSKTSFLFLVEYHATQLEEVGGVDYEEEEYEILYYKQM